LIRVVNLSDIKSAACHYLPPVLCRLRSEACFDLPRLGWLAFTRSSFLK